MTTKENCDIVIKSNDFSIVLLSVIFEMFLCKKFLDRA